MFLATFLSRLAKGDIWSVLLKFAFNQVELICTISLPLSVCSTASGFESLDHNKNIFTQLGGKAELIDLDFSVKIFDPDVFEVVEVDDLRVRDARMANSFELERPLRRR